MCNVVNSFEFQVTDNKNNSSGDLKDLVSQATSLQKAGELPTSMLAQLFVAVSDKINDNYSEDDKQKVARYSAFRQRLKCMENHYSF